MAQEVKTIKVVLSASGDAKKVLDALGEIKKSMKSVAAEATAFGRIRDIMTKAFAFNIAGMGVSALTNMADSITMTRERLIAFGQDAEGANETLGKLSEIATATRQPFQDIASNFSRVSIATKTMGLNVDAQLEATQMLAQTFKLSGATAEEASGGMTQITQAMSRGVLRGQELISVMSNNATLAGLLSEEAKSLGKNIYEMGEKGQITNKFFFKVLAKNFQDINKMAQNTRPTFQQGVTLAMNELVKAVDEVNQKFGISDGFMASIKWLIDNKDLIVAGIVAIGTALSISLIKNISTGAVALAGLVTKINPVVAALSLVAAGAYLIYENFDKVRLYAEKFFNTILIGAKMVSFAFTTIMASTPEDFDKMKTLTHEVEALRKANEGLDVSISNLGKSQKSTELTGDGLKNAIGGIQDKAATLAEQIAALNLRFNQGKIDIESYNSKLLDLQKKSLKEEVFIKGTKSIEKMNEEMSKNQLDAYGRLLEYGKISLEGFNDKVRDFKLEELNRKFKDGKIDVAEYSIKVAELDNRLLSLNSSLSIFLKGAAAGMAKHLQGIGTWASGMASITDNAFTSFEDAIFNASKGAADAWSNMTQAILDDITRLVIRMAIVKPLIQGVMGYIGGGTPDAAGGTTAASTDYLNQKATPFAMGGIVNTPTYFGSASKMGVMGEAGPEAIMPLTRMSDGSLGVTSSGGNTVVNIINNSGSEVSQTQSTGPNGEKIIDVLIMSKIKEGIASGAFDKTFSQNYGLRRRGV